MQEEKNVKEIEKNRKRGRPKTEHKKYKNVGFRLEEELYDKCENIAQNEGNVSIHTFIKDNINQIFFNRETNFYIPISKNMTTLYSKVENFKNPKKDFNGISELFETFIENYIFRKILNIFLDEYCEKTLDDISFKMFFELSTLIHFYLETPINTEMQTRQYNELLHKKIYKFLEISPPTNEVIKFYFFGTEFKYSV